MKTITTNNRTLLFVEVPEDATDITLNELGRLDYLTQGGMDYAMLPSGNYRFIATTDKVALVDKINILGGGVFHPNLDWDSYFECFLEKHGITGRHAIIEVL